MSRGVYFPADLLTSEAFRSLSKWSYRTFFGFMQKRVMKKNKHKSRSDSYSITNNGEIVFTYREAKKIGIGEREFRNSIDELIDKGFLDIARYGKGGRSGEATLYFIDDRWKKYGTNSFRPPKKPRIKQTIQGKGWAAYNAKNKRKGDDKNDSATTDKSVRRSGEKNKKRMTKTTAVKKQESSASP